MESNVKGGQDATHGKKSGVRSDDTSSSNSPYGSFPGAARGAEGGGSGNVDGNTSPVRSNRLAYQQGHSFIRKTFRTPTNCHYCTELLWGLMGQGYICEGNLMF